MFLWLKNKKKKELLKLIFQSHGFLNVHTQLNKSDVEAKEWFEFVTNTNDNFMKSGDIDDLSLRRLLEINKKIRIFYTQNDPEIKMYKAGLLSKKPMDFDSKFKPILGWEEHYRSYGL